MAPPPATERPLLVVTVGTDHHPFGRLVGWVDDYVASATCRPVDLVCQHGEASAPRAGRGFATVDHATLQGHLATATAVVCHGGPSTVLETRRLGRVPIVVPRLHRFGEAVDDHQVDFARFLARRRQIVLVDSEDGLRAALDRALADPARFRIDTDRRCEPSTARAVERFAAVAAETSLPRRTVLWFRVARGHSSV
jgi:UDP-N-acetylglucosamine transferase subunit ALG13